MRNVPRVERYFDRTAEWWETEECEGNVEGIRGSGDNNVKFLLCQVKFPCHRVTETKAGGRTVKSDYGEILTLHTY